MLIHCINEYVPYIQIKYAFHTNKTPQIIQLEHLRESLVNLTTSTHLSCQDPILPSPSI